MNPIAITPGEPAGIGPEIVVKLLQQVDAARCVVVADYDLMNRVARQLGADLVFSTTPDRGEVHCRHVDLRAEVRPGHLNPGNASYVVETLARATDGCLNGEYAAMVTAPVHKGVINDGGIPFTGHTEFLAERTGARQVVMLLAAGTLRVALATTHLPLREVPDAITPELLERVLRVLMLDLTQRFGLAAPRVAVCGLNPHAGEGGHLGHEEIEIMVPTLERLRREGMDLVGPLPADTAFTPRALEHIDAVLAMYHDQGLPVLKHAGFGHAVNVTLGLPIIRTSVDHGTALDLAGTGRADAGSLVAAWRLACALAAGAAGAVKSEK